MREGTTSRVMVAEVLLVSFMIFRTSARIIVNTLPFM
jgi:hypothetical protein